MSSLFLAEFLALPAIRDARRNHDFAILDEALGAVLFAGSAGCRRFGIADGALLPPLLARQIQSAARLVAVRGGANLSLRVASGPIAPPVAARLLRAETALGAAAVLLHADPLDAQAPDETAADLLAALGCANAASLFASDGEPASAAALADPGGQIGEAVRAFAESGEPTGETRAATGAAARFFRIADDRVLAVMTQGAHPEADASSPDRDAVVPFDPPAENEPALPSDAPLIEAPETRQPVEMLSVATLPDPRVPDGVESAETPPAFVPHLEDAPARFVWQIDAEGRFRSFSPEFAAAVGPHAETLLGRTFGEVADEFGFDEDGAIRRLLERRDTWSGRTVLWPVETTDKRVPIDLAALPIYSRERVFEGFRGFGIVRGLDHEPDPEKRGLGLAERLHAARSAPRGEAPELATPAETPAASWPAERPVSPEKPMFRTFEAELPGVSFGRRQAPPPSPASDEDRNDASTGRTGGERRRISGEPPFLSEAEEAAFREIGAELGRRRSEAETPGALRFEAESAGTVVRSELRPLGPSQATVPPNAPEDASHDASPGDEPAAGLGDVEPVLAVLATPLLVQSANRLVYANPALLALAGHADLSALEAAGGLAALFADNDGEPVPGRMAIRRTDGATLDARVHMQRVPIEGRSALLISFEPDAAPAEEPPAPVAAAPAADENEARRRFEELQAVLDIATDGVVLADPDGTIRAANGSAQALFGSGEAELRGLPLADLFAEESKKTVLDYLETLRHHGIAGVMNDGREVVGRVAQGGFVPLFITLGRVPDERGWCVVIRDMSHWKRAEEELVNAKRAAEAASLHKSRFLANISHELRTPLNAIIGFADVMASECFGPIGSERYIEYLGDIKRSGHHVLDLVNDLLDISKIEAGKLELSFEAVSLNEVLAEVVATMQPQANRERVIVRSNLPASVPPVVADRRTMRQIALNLLSNSVRFTPAGGQIIASTTYTAAGDVLMRVRDSGIGMTPREIEIALKPFQQVHQPGEAGRGEGTGLGLPLTKAMAEANRASFAIRSTPGEGTLVEIGFPAQRVLGD